MSDTECPGCGKSYQVEDGGRLWFCMKCGWDDTGMPQQADTSWMSPNEFQPASGEWFDEAAVQHIPNGAAPPPSQKPKR